MIIVLSALALMVGFMFGWISSERFHAYLDFKKHDFEELFQKNPHPELFDEDGNLDRGEYMNIMFEPGYDPDEFDPEDITDYGKGS